MKVKKSVVAAALIRAGVIALAFFVPWAATRASAQRVEQVLGGDAGRVSSESQRLAALMPDPVKSAAPRTKWDGKPDFSGLYWTSTYLPTNAARAPALRMLDSLYRPEAIAARAKMNPEDSPGMHCWPESPANGGMHPGLNFQLVSAPGFFAVINEYGANYRIIPTDGRRHDPSAKPTFGGDSVGHWEGDTLVVDVTNFKVRDKFGIQFQDTWSDAMHVVERWTMPDARFVEYEAVIDDPKMLTGPWTAPKLRRGRMANNDVSQESLCFQADQSLETINREQREYSQKGLRKPRDRGQGEGRDGANRPIAKPSPR